MDRDCNNGRGFSESKLLLMNEGTYTCSVGLGLAKLCECLFGDRGEETDKDTFIEAVRANKVTSRA